MPLPPFVLVQCSWPRPIEECEGRWASEPEWDAPTMPFLPQPRWEAVQGQNCWMLDWYSLFASDTKSWGFGSRGEMRNFHVVFRVQLLESGTLHFWDDDGSIIRRNGTIVHEDRTVHPLTHHEIAVHAGDELEIAHWQAHGGWLWAARLEASIVDEDAKKSLSPYRKAIDRALAKPNGPPLKLYCSGAQPWRTIVCLYSMILNGYRPSQVLLYGDYQWSEKSGQLFREWVEFAQVVTKEELLARIYSLGQPRLADYAEQYWYVMKDCVTLLTPPDEFCLMDDDIFILDRVDLALDAFTDHDLVYMQDIDYSGRYIHGWRHLCHGRTLLATGTFNGGLFWLRNRKDQRQLAEQALRVSPQHVQAMDWDQGHVAANFAEDKIWGLPTNRYFYPIFDGLPGGLYGYDYATNPCNFISVHFGGLLEKPSDAAALRLAPAILNRQKALSGG